MRKKVKYDITKYGKNKTFHFSGIGEIDEENLYTEYQNKAGETVEHIYEDCLKDLHPVLDKPNQLKGGFFEYENIQYENNKGQIINYETEVDYKIWLKII